MSIEEIGPFSFSDEQALLMDSAQRFVREDNAAHPIGTGAGPRAFCRERWRTYADLGWLGIAVRGADGGLDGSLKDVAALMEGVGPGLLPDPIISSAIFATALIAQSPESALRSTWLNRMAGGDAVVAVAHEEIGVHNPPVVHASDTPAGLRLHGTSVLSWFAAEADAIIVFGRLAGSNEPALILVDRATSVVIAESYLLLDGSRAADLRFEDTLVERSALLMSGGAAQSAFDIGLDRAIVAHAAMAIGIARDAMIMTSQFLKDRVQFGGPIARFQSLQHRVAEMFVQYQDAVSALAFAIEACEHGEATERAMMVSAAKVVVGDALKFIGSQAIQLHGAIGLTEEYRVGHYYRKILMFQGMFGDGGFHFARYEHSRALREAA